MAGSWEFPGGKLVAGEERIGALRRELAEELGIDVLEAKPLLELVHDYPEKRVLLDVWRVLRYRGEAEGREGQLLRWVAVDELAGLPLLEADGPIIEALRALPARG
jgi:8-oxo-dGTP diphosphatase